MLELYERLKINYGSCDLQINDIGKKVIMNSTSWDDPYNKDKNCVRAKTGEINGFCDLDLDDMKNPVCQKLEELADKCCNFKYRTKKGFHYWFRFDEDLKQTIHKKEYGFDFLANGGLTFCPPTNYLDFNKQRIVYTFVIQPEENQRLNRMSDELKDELKRLFIDRIKPKDKLLNKEIKLEQHKTEKAKIENSEKNDIEMAKILNLLNINRADDYCYWIITGLALKSAGYNLKLWDDFSRRSNKYREGETSYLWTYLNPNRITTKTIYYWLKLDNPEEFQKSKSKINNYNKTINMKDEKEFSDEIFYKMLKEDKDLLNSDYEKYFEQTISFKYFNHFHMHITYGNIFYAITYDNYKQYLSSISSIKDTYLEYKEFINLWLGSAKRQKYKKLDFLPNQVCPSSTYNMFSNFLYEKENKTYNYDKIKPLLDHLILLCNNKDVSDYLIKWWASIRQHPDKKSLVAIVLYSDTQGTGKNTAVDIVGSLFKGYTASITESDIGKKFNKKFEGKLLIWGDEISGNNKHDSNALKNLITQTIQNIEPKGKDEYECRDNSNYMFTTNYDSAFKIEEKDRRMLLINCLEKCESVQYYKHLQELLKDDEVLYELDKYISTIDLSTFDIKSLPKTELKRQNILRGLPCHVQMLKSKPHLFSGETKTAKALLNYSKEYARENKLSSIFTENKVYKDLFKFLEDYKTTDRISSYSFPSNFAEVVDNLIESKI